MSFSEVHFLSQTLSRNVSCAVFMPERGGFGSNAKPPYKTVYFLPGYSGDYTSIYTMLSFRKQAELKGLAVVIPDGDNAFYVDHPERNQNYSTFIGKELIERTRDMFNLSDKREDTYIAGVSMGGYGALYNGLKFHDVFSKAAAMSPACDMTQLLEESGKAGGFGDGEFAAMFGSRQEYREKGYDLAKDYAEAEKADIPELWIGCGDRDIAVGTQVDGFRNALDQASVPYTWFGCYGNHDVDTWEEMMDPMFSFLAGIKPGTRNSLRIPDSMGEKDAIVK